MRDDEISRIVYEANPPSFTEASNKSEAKLRIHNWTPSSSQVAFHLSAFGGNIEVFEEVIDEDSNVSSWSKIGRVNDVTQYVVWVNSSSPDVPAILEAVDNGIFLETAVREPNEDWKVSGVASHEDFQFLDSLHRKHGMNWNPRRIVSNPTEDSETFLRSPLHNEGEMGLPEEYLRCLLTEQQFEVVRRLTEGGYFNEPREIHISDVANELNISTKAVSERLRRAQGNLFKSPDGSLDDTWPIL